MVSGYFSSLNRRRGLNCRTLFIFVALRRRFVNLICLNGTMPTLPVIHISLLTPRHTWAKPRGKGEATSEKWAKV